MILIDVEMPQNCTDCPCNNDFMNCGVTHKSFYEDGNADALDIRPEWCPLKNSSDLNSQKESLGE